MKTFQTFITEIRGRIPSAASIEKSLYGKVSDEAKKKAVAKYHKHHARERELLNKPDSHTGKYAKEINSLTRKRMNLASKYKLSKSDLE